MSRATLDVSVIVPNLDGGVKVLGAVRSVFDQSGPSFEVILVDNGSTDGSPDDVVREFGVVRVLRNAHNTGFAPACNQGASEARARYLLFLNNDAVLPPRAIADLVAAADRDAAAAIWQPLIVSEDGGVESGGTQITRAGFLWPLTDEVGAGPYPVFSATAACMLVRRKVFEALGGFPASYFAYFEDADLCWRARMAGWEVRIVPRIRVPHGRGTTTRRIFEPSQIYYLGYRNRLRSLLANPARGTRLYLVPLQVVSCLLISLGFCAALRFGPAYAVLRALAWPLANVRDVREARRRAQAARSCPDTEVFRRDLMIPLTPRRAWELFSGNLGRWRRPDVTAPEPRE